MEGHKDPKSGFIVRQKNGLEKTQFSVVR